MQGAAILSSSLSLSLQIEGQGPCDLETKGWKGPA